MVTSQSVVPLSAQAIDIPDHILEELKLYGIGADRVRRKVLSLTQDRDTWKPIKKWALAKKVWEKTHHPHVHKRLCYTSLPTNRLTLHPLVRNLVSRFVEVVNVELWVNYEEKNGVQRARVEWYTETRIRDPKRNKPR